MFDIGWSELLVIAAVALIAIGPKELPGVLRSVGHWMGKIRRMAAEFQSQFQEAMREAEMADLKKTADELNEATKSLTHIDPLADLEKSAAEMMAPPADATAPSPAAHPEPEAIPAAELSAEPAVPPERTSEAVADAAKGAA
jgi:sec-independent protein translocase protein TatB